MVNEMNKPQPPTENAALGERLLESHRQLQEMQQEHQVLLQEMEQLRHRALQLSRISDRQNPQLQQQQQQQTTQQPQPLPLPQQQEQQQLVTTEAGAREQEQESPSADNVCNNTSSTDTVEKVATTNNSQNSVNAPHQIQPDNGKSTVSTTPESEVSTEAAGNTESDDPEAANYLNEKLAEIARLKAQYKRVQLLINTTNMIEEHISSCSSSTAEPTVTEPNQTQSTEVPTNSSAIPTADPTTSTNPNTFDEKEELISVMMNMFTDFSSDLRSQAESLRAERERIRALKEELLSRRKGN